MPKMKGRCRKNFMRKTQAICLKECGSIKCKSFKGCLVAVHSFTLHFIANKVIVAYKIYGATSDPGQPIACRGRQRKSVYVLSLTYNAFLNT